jgi:hypothetical protein
MQAPLEPLIRAASMSTGADKPMMRVAGSQGSTPDRQAVIAMPVLRSARTGSYGPEDDTQS